MRDAAMPRRAARTARRALLVPAAALLGACGVALLAGCGAPEAREDTEEAKEEAMPAPAIRKGTRLQIDGVPSLGWGKGKECTFAGALEAALAATDHPCGYVDLMGLSGLAMRVRWYQGKTGQRWCPSSPVGEFPEEIAAIQKATGWPLRVECLLGQESMDMTRFVPEIVASISAGRAVPAYTKDLNMGVVYGYEDAGHALLVRGYAPETPERLPVSELGPMAIFLGEHGPPLPRGDAVREALRIAVRNWRREPVAAPNGQYLYGDAALAAWAEDIGRAGDLSETDRNQLFFCTWWNFDGLWDARKAAGPFLDDAAGALEGEGRAALLRAAALCRQELQALDAAKDAFLGPWTGKNVAAWSPEVRQREQAVLAEARKVEAAAIAEIEKALAAEGG
jgi:hypothetical protein